MRAFRNQNFMVTWFTNEKLIGRNDFSFQFRKIITLYRCIGYNLNVMRQSACLVFNPIMVDNYAAFFNWLIIMLLSLIARRWVESQTLHKAFHFSW